MTTPNTEDLRALVAKWRAIAEEDKPANIYPAPLNEVDGVTGYLWLGLQYERGVYEAKLELAYELEALLDAGGPAVAADDVDKACATCCHIAVSPAHDKPHGQMLTTGFESHPFQPATARPSAGTAAVCESVERLSNMCDSSDQINDAKGQPCLVLEGSNDCYQHPGGKFPATAVAADDVPTVTIMEDVGDPEWFTQPSQCAVKVDSAGISVAQMTTHSPAYPPLVNVTEARKMLGGRGRGKIYKLIDGNEIDSVKDGNRRMIVTASILAYIDRLEHTMTKAPPAEQN